MLQTTRNCDELGRIVLPLEMRTHLGWDETTPITFELVENGILFAKAYDTCAICGSDEHLYPCKGRYLCKACIDAIEH